MNKTTKCFLLSFLIASSSINSMEFISHISGDFFKSFIKENRAFALLLCTVTGIGLYGLYKYKSSQKSIIMTHVNNPDNTTQKSTAENVRWVKTNDGKVIKIHEKVANNIFHLDERIERDEKIKILQLYCEHVLKIKPELNLDIQTPDNSENNPYNIPCSKDDLRLIINATSLICRNMSLLQYTQNELDTLKALAHKFEITFILSAISSIKIAQLAHDILPQNRPDLLPKYMPLLLNTQKISAANLFRDIMSTYIKPEVLTKEQFKGMQQENPSQKKMLKLWIEVTDSWGKKTS